MSATDEAKRAAINNEDQLEAFRQTEEYKQLNNAERIIAEGEFRVSSICPDYGKETDFHAKMERSDNDASYRFAEVIKSETFLDLKRHLENGDFNADEAAVAAKWLRENYDNGYDLHGVEQSAKEDLVFNGETVDENAPNAIPVCRFMDGQVIAYVDANEVDKEFSDDMRGKKNGVDADATNGVIKAIDNDASFSDEDKNKRALDEARGYCDRVDEDYESDHTEQNRDLIKRNVLRYHPELASQLEREGTSDKMHEDRTNADNVEKVMEMNPEQGAKLVSKSVREGAENAGVDTSISENAPKMNEGVEAKPKQNDNPDRSSVDMAYVARLQGQSR